MITDAALQNADFDESEYLRRALHLPGVEGEQARLNRSIELIQTQIRTVIAENTEPLLQQVDSAVEVERDVSAIQGSLAALGSSSRRLKHTVEAPYKQIAAKLCEVKHSQEVLEVLRNVQRFLSLVAKLPELLTSDVSRAARSLHDVEELLASGQLAGIHVVDRQLENVTKCSASIRSKAHEMLKASIASHNQAELAMALQCFFSLGTLARVATNIVAEHKREAVKTLVRELDVQNLAAAEGTKLREITFSKLEISLSDVVQRNATVMLLWKVLSKRKDPTTQELFVSAIEGGASTLLGDYWSAIASQLQEKLAKLSKRGSVFAMILSEYQRWYLTLKNFVQSTEELFSALGDVQMGKRWLESVTKGIEDEFTSQSLERHRDKVQQIVSRISTQTPGSGAEGISMDVHVDVARPALPALVTSIDVKGLVKIINQEAAGNRQDHHILTIVIKNAVISLQHLRQKMGDALAKVVLPPLPSITGNATAAQIFYISMANAATTVFNDMSNIAGVLPASDAWEDNAGYAVAHQRLRDACAPFDTFAGSIISPFLASAQHALMKCISVCTVENAENSSIEQLQSRVNHLASRFVYLFDRSAPSVESQLSNLTSRLALRVTVKMLLTRTPSEATAAFFAKLLDSLPSMLQLICFMDNPSKMQLRAVKAAIASFAADGAAANAKSWVAMLRHIHPLLAVIGAIQHVPQSQLPPIPALLENADKLVDAIEGAVFKDLDGDCFTSSIPVWEEMNKCLLQYKQSDALASEEAKSLRVAVLGLAEECRQKIYGSSQK